MPVVDARPERLFDHQADLWLQTGHCVRRSTTESADQRGAVVAHPGLQPTSRRTRHPDRRPQQHEVEAAHRHAQHIGRDAPVPPSGRQVHQGPTIQVDAPLGQRGHAQIGHPDRGHPTASPGGPCRQRHRQRHRAVATDRYGGAPPDAALGQQRRQILLHRNPLPMGSSGERVGPVPKHPCRRWSRHRATIQTYVRFMVATKFRRSGLNRYALGDAASRDAGAAAVPFGDRARLPPSPRSRSRPAQGA